MDFLVMCQNIRYFEYPMHCHNYWEILYNIDGEGTAIINGQKYPFYKGTIFCIHPGIPHTKFSDNGFIDGSILIEDFCFKSHDESVLIFQDDEHQSLFTLFKLAHEHPHNPLTDVYVH